MSVYNGYRCIGRLVDDPKHTAGEEPSKNRCSFKLAIPDWHAAVGADGKRRADFLRFTAWGKNADNIFEHCRKGKELSVEGRIRQNLKTVDGVTKEYIEVVVETVHFGPDAGARTKKDEETSMTKEELIASVTASVLAAQATARQASADPFPGNIG